MLLLLLLLAASGASPAACDSLPRAVPKAAVAAAEAHASPAAPATGAWLSIGRADAPGESLPVAAGDGVAAPFLVPEAGLGFVEEVEEARPASGRPRPSRAALSSTPRGLRSLPPPGLSALVQGADVSLSGLGLRCRSRRFGRWPAAPGVLGPCAGGSAASGGPNCSRSCCMAASSASSIWILPRGWGRAGSGMYHLFCMWGR